jgi:hypothetical protein
MSAHPADYKVNVEGLGHFVSSRPLIVMRQRDSCVLERRIEPQRTAHIRFVGEAARDKRPSKKYYSVDLDDFQL